MRRSWQLLSWLSLVGGVTSCGSGDNVGPTLEDLQGRWRVSWTEAGSGTTCSWTDVELIIRDSTEVPPTEWSGGQGSCVGVYETGDVTFRETALDSFVVTNGRLRFAIGSYQFQGHAVGDQMSGAVSHELPIMIGDAPVRISGQWQAFRIEVP